MWRHTIYEIGSKIDCVAYTGMYNFMKEIPLYIFAVKNHCHLRFFIIDKSWRICDSGMKFAHKPGASVVISPLMYHYQGPPYFLMFGLPVVLFNVVKLN